VAALRFRQSADTFTVEEIPLFEPSGEGGHLYLTIRRRDISTPYLLRTLQKRLGVKEPDIGCAGNKDRDATTIQTISLPAALETRAGDVLGGLGVEVLGSARHEHKLRTGKLKGNRFTAVIEWSGPDERERLEAACAHVREHGFPNAFGPQRFGDGRAVEEGRLLFSGLRRFGSFRKSRFAVSVFQAHLFNQLLELRQERGLYPGPVAGDLMKKHDTGGEFVAEAPDPEIERRIRALEISPTGPIPGRKMPHPALDALELEREVLAANGLNEGSLMATKAPGARRFLRVPAGSLALQAFSPHSGSDDSGIATLAFFLPPGSYANVLLRTLGCDILKPGVPAAY
jgi:tRNA pseudouridine13 synthase